MQHADPTSYQPTLRWWSHLWRFLAMATISGLAWYEVASDQLQYHRVLLGMDVTLGVVAFVLVQYRRRWPVAIAVLTTLFGFVSTLSVGPGLLAAVSLATRRRWPELVVISVLGLAAGPVYEEVQPVTDEPWFITIATNLVFTVAILAVGMYIGSRRELLWTLRERALRAEAEQELRVAQARTNERGRIAREMHDVLAHRISLVTMHAGALAYRTDLSRDEIARSAEVIQSNAHEALTDLRQVLGVLRGDEPASDRPQPAYGDVAALIDEAVGSGMHVEYAQLVRSADRMPQRVGGTVYRIVQEGLTNARKHAPGARVKVDVTGGPEDGVEVVVRNPLSFGIDRHQPVSGLGLIGLGERVELTGGRLEHQADAKEFRLHGWLPWAP